MTRKWKRPNGVVCEGQHDWGRLMMILRAGKGVDSAVVFTG